MTNWRSSVTPILDVKMFTTHEFITPVVSISHRTELYIEEQEFQR